MKNIIILGGGLSGLAAAEKLAGKYNVTVLEKEDLLGGLARSYNYKGNWIPITYHHVMNVDKITLYYIKKYGLLKKLYWNSINMTFWFGKKSFPLTKPQHIALFKPLSIISRINLVKLGIYVRFKGKWKNLEGIPADKWLNRFAGREITEKLFSKLAEIKFGSLSSVDAAWFGARLHEAAKTREKYAYLSCGYQELIGRIANNIRKRGGKIRTNALVKKVKANKVYAEIKGKSEVFKADKIISSIPPKTLSKIAELPHNSCQELNKIEYKPVICMLLTSKQRIFKDYWNIFVRPKLGFGGIFSHSSIYPKRVVKGENLYYVFKYVDPGDNFYKLSEENIKKAFLKDLKGLFPLFKPSWAKVFKIKESSPVFARNYKNPPIKISSNTYLTGVYREYPCTRTMHTALKSGIKTANFILDEIVRK